jgi:hypothetical protein
MKQLNLLILFLSLNLITHGQTDSSQKKPFLKLNGIGFRIGGGISEPAILYKSDYNKMAPGNSLGQFDTSGYKNSSYLGSGNFDFGAYATFKPYCKKTNSYSSKFSLGICFAFQSSAAAHIEYKKTDSLGKFPYTDANNNTIMRDSIDIHEYKFSYINRNLNLETFVNYNFVYTPMFRMYTGINLGVGVTIGNYVLVQYNRGTENLDRFVEWHGYRFKYDSQEKTKLNSDLLLNYSVPLGMQIKLRKKGKGLYLNPELRVGGKISRMPNYSFTHRLYGILNVGLRYNF